MKLARIIGSIWATRKDERMESRRLLLGIPMRFDGTRSGSVVTMMDTVDSGVGDLVIYATSSEAAVPFRPGLTPTDATVVGVVDRIDHEAWTYVNHSDQEGGS